MINQIGKRLFYDKTTGKVLHDTGERAGHVIETTPTEDYPAYNPDTVDYIQLEYGQYAEQFVSCGSYEVDLETRDVVFYDRVTIASDKTQIENDGADAATITIQLPVTTTETVEVRVNGGTVNPLAVADSKATFSFSTEIEGDYVITVNANKYGTAAVLVKGV